MKYLKIALTIASVIAVPTYRIWPAFLQVSNNYYNEECDIVENCYAHSLCDYGGTVGN